MFYEHILTLVGLNVRMFVFLQRPYPWMERYTEWRHQALSQVHAGPCNLKSSYYIIGKLVIAAINDFPAIVTKQTISSRIIHMQTLWFPITNNLYKKSSGSFNNKIVLAKVMSVSSKHFGTKSSHWIILKIYVKQCKSVYFWKYVK